MIFSIPSDNAIDKLKWFIYLTNEFGVPSEENIELFIKNFGRIIMNKNLKINPNTEKHLASLWNEISLDKNAKKVYSGGIDFYIKLSNAKFASEQEIVDFIKLYKIPEETKVEAVNQDVEKSENILQIVRKYSKLALSYDVVTAYLTEDLIVDIYPKEQKIRIKKSKRAGLNGNEYNCLEEVTLQYILDELEMTISEMNNEVIELYKEYLNKWKDINYNQDINYLYE